MKDLPGVDPDGRNPGGLEVAGNVEAGSMSLGGTALVSAVPIDIFSAFSNAGTTVTSHATLTPFTPIPLDTVSLTSATYSLSVDKKTLTIHRPGVYLAFVTPILDSGSISAGQMIGYLTSTETVQVQGADGSGAAADNGAMTGLSMTLIIVTGTSDCQAVVAQSSGGDLPMDVGVIVLRLGDAP